MTSVVFAWIRHLRRLGGDIDLDEARPGHVAIALPVDPLLRSHPAAAELRELRDALMAHQAEAAAVLLAEREAREAAHRVATDPTTPTDREPIVRLTEWGTLDTPTEAVVLPDDVA